MTKMFDFVLKGANASQLEKDIGSDMFPANEHYFGLVNVSRFLMSIFYHQIYEIFPPFLQKKYNNIRLRFSSGTHVTQILCYKHYIFVNHSVKKC